MKGRVRLNINRLAKIEHHAVPVKRDEKFFASKENQLIKDTDEKSDLICLSSQSCDVGMCECVNRVNATRFSLNHRDAP